MLKEVPYTPEEAERAAGMGSYIITSTKPLLEQIVEMEDKETVLPTDNNTWTINCCKLIKVCLVQVP